MSARLEARELAIHVAGRVLVEALSLSVAPGEVWAVLGANGAGKTLLLETLAGLRAASRGEVRLEGRPIAQCPAAEAARLRGFLPQAVHDAFSTSALEVAMLGRHPHMSRWDWEGEEERGRALAALEAVEMAPMAARDVTTLSGGERQRVSIAALLAHDAPLMILDEPLAHLDVHHQISVLAHLAGLAARERKAVIVSLHDLNLAARFATHAVLFRGDGRAEVGAVDDVMAPEALSGAFRYRVARAELAGRRVFVPD